MLIEKKAIKIPEHGRILNIILDWESLKWHKNYKAIKGAIDTLNSIFNLQKKKTKNITDKDLVNIKH